MLVVILGFSSAMAWGVADFLGGLKTRRLALAAVAVASQLTGLLVALALVAITADAPPPAAAFVYAALAGVANTVGLLAFYRGLAVGRMSVVAPIVGMSAVVPVTAGLARGDRPGALQAAGMVVGVLGIVLASRQIDGDPRPTAGSSTISTILALVAAAGVGGNLLGLDAAIDASGGGNVMWALATTRATCLALLLAGAVAARHAVRPPARELPSLALLGALDLAANVLYALAVQRAMLSLAAVLASMHPVFTVVLARLVLSERVRRVQQLGVGLALVGVSLIAGG